MTALQVKLSREIGGWPLYTIIIALGQVDLIPRCLLYRLILLLDVECYQLPNHIIDGSKLARRHTALRAWRRIPYLFRSLVSIVPDETLRLRSFTAMDFLWSCFLPYRASFNQCGTTSSPSRFVEYCHLVLRGGICCRFPLLRA